MLIRMAFAPKLLGSILSFGCERPDDLFRFSFPEYEPHRRHVFSLFQNVSQVMTSFSIPFQVSALREWGVRIFAA